jgi:hypothetical protein
MIETNSKPIQKCVYLDEKTLDLLDKVSDYLSISRSAVIRILINQYCKGKKEDFKDIIKQIDFEINKEDL